jgi:hypothetical protein
MMASQKVANCCVAANYPVTAADRMYVSFLTNLRALHVTVLLSVVYLIFLFQATASPGIAALTSFGLVPSPCVGTRHFTRRFGRQAYSLPSAPQVSAAIGHQVRREAKCIAHNAVPSWYQPLSSAPIVVFPLTENPCL